MTTELRLRELCDINNHIVTECDKMMQYLQIIKEKSEYAITYLNTQNTANFLRQYSTAYEYLNKFYIKLLDQNCLFELFFLELDEPSATDLLSAQPSIKDLTADAANFDSQIRNYSETQEKLTHNLFSNGAGLVHQQNHVDILNERYDDISGIIRTKDTKLSAECKEFQPQSNSTNTSLSSRDVVIEQSSISSKSDFLPKMENTDTAEKSKIVNILSETNVAQHNLQSFNKNSSIKGKNKQKIIEKTTTLDMFSVSSTTSEIQAVEINKKHKKPAETKNKDKMAASENKDNLIDVQIKDVINKLRANELKSSVVIPDLRPKVVRKDTESSASSQTQQSSCSPPTKQTKHQQPVHKKTNHSSRVENDIIHQNIVSKRGPTPKEGDLCCISSIESPASFYMHVIRDDNTLIDSLSEQIGEISHSLKSFYNKRDAKKCIKSLCVCYINAHQAWCRVEIENWMMEHEQMIVVRLIDYGLTCKVPLRNIREANQYFFALPVMVDKCELAWVKPLKKREEWSKESIDHFNKLVSESDRLFTISYVEDDGGRLIVDLQTSKIDSIVGMMIADGKAAADDESDDSKIWSNEFMRKQIIKSQGFTEQELNQAEEDRLEALMFNDDDDDEEIADPNLAVSHYNPKDEREICRIFLKRGHCFKGRNCTFSHAPLNPDGWTTDREAVFYDAFNQLELPEPGSEITVKVVNIVDLRTFYVVVKNLPECTNLIGLPVNNIRSLVRLMNDPEETKSYARLNVIPALGEIILVKYENNWQRGRVVDMDEFANKIELEVLLVDFGIVRKFSMKHCRKIAEHHLHIPFQVVLCTLCNVTMKDDLTEEDNDMGCDYLEINVEMKKLKANVMYTSNYLSVHLFTENGQDIGEELIKAGIVDRCSSSLTSVAEHSLLVD